MDIFMHMAINDCIELFILMPFILIFLATLSPYFLIPSFFLIVIVFKFYKYCKVVIVKTREIDLVSKSPIFTLFNNTVAGILPIRVYN